MDRKKSILLYLQRKKYDIIVYSIMYCLVFLLLYVMYTFAMAAIECNANGGVYISQVASFPTCFNP